MADDKRLEDLLKAWGLYYGERPRIERHNRTLAHPVARAMQYAECRPGRTVKHATRKLMGRGGWDRRMLMGAAAGLTDATGHVRPIPMDYCDPVPCPRDIGGGGGGGGASRDVARPVPREIQRVQQEVKALEEINLIRGLCVRAQYCVEGSPDDRAVWVTDEFRKASPRSDPINVNKFRNEVAFGKVWMHARLIETVPA